MSLLKQMYPQYSVGYYCQLFGRSRQSWYEQRRGRSDKQLWSAMIIGLVKELRRELPGIGVSKLQYLMRKPLAEHGISIGRDGLYRLLGEHGYLLRHRKRKAKTTSSGHSYRKYANIARDIVLERASELWVSDITYLRVGEGFGYLSIVTDAYSRKIVGYCLHPSLESYGAVRALQMALKEKQRGRTLTHHSDRGVQYCCRAYVEVLEQHGIRISMTENGDPYENAIAERVNGILKEEFNLQGVFSTLEQAQQAVDVAVQNYNHLRPHASCDYLTPVQASQHSGVLAKRWKKKVYKPSLEAESNDTSITDKAMQE